MTISMKRPNCSPRRLATALGLSGVLIASSCGSTVADSNDVDISDSKGLSGQITVSGSSTVEPVSSRVAELYAGKEGGVNVKVDGPGTGDGFKLFCEGSTDITGASRAIKDEEISDCEDEGINYVELKIAFDGIAVLANPSNDSVSCLSFNDLYAMVSVEADGIKKWSDATTVAGELGSTTELPDLPLEITAPGAESGTYDSFIELVLEDIAEGRAEAGKITEEQIKSTRTDYNSAFNDNRIIEGVSGQDGGFGWVGYAFAEEAGDKVKELEIDGGDGCVAPTIDTIADGSYPVSRPLFIYVNADNAASNEALVDFVDFYLNNAYTEAVTKAFGDAGYIELPEAEIEKTRSSWEAAK